MKKVMVFGTFDLIHPGHQNFFRQAKRRGDFLLVVVARDKYVEKAKGRRPKNSEQFRVKSLRKDDLVEKAILGSKTHNYFQTIRTYAPDTIALGYDQKPSLRQLKRELKRHRIKNISVLRLRPYKPEIYKTAKLLNTDG